MTDLPTLRQERDAAREKIRFADVTCECLVGDPVDACQHCKAVATLLRLEGDVRVLEAAEAVERKSEWLKGLNEGAVSKGRTESEFALRRQHQEGVAFAAAFLRSLLSENTQ